MRLRQPWPGFVNPFGHRPPGREGDELSHLKHGGLVGLSWELEFFERVIWL